VRTARLTVRTILAFGERAATEQPPPASA
jgi:hypothetical protein